MSYLAVNFPSAVATFASSAAPSSPSTSTESGKMEESASSSSRRCWRSSEAVSPIAVTVATRWQEIKDFFRGNTRCNSAEYKCFRAKKNDG